MRRGLAAVVAVAALALAGCGGPGYSLVPAGGVVKINGVPAPNVSVQFLPVGQTGPTSYGSTDAEGRFTLKTAEGSDGAIAGKHKVTLVDQEEERPAQGQVAKRKPRMSDKLATPAGGIDAEVTAGGGPIELLLPAVR